VPCASRGRVRRGPLRGGSKRTGLIGVGSPPGIRARVRRAAEGDLVVGAYGNHRGRFVRCDLELDTHVTVAFAAADGDVASRPQRDFAGREEAQFTDPVQRHPGQIVRLQLHRHRDPHLLDQGAEALHLVPQYRARIRQRGYRAVECLRLTQHIGIIEPLGAGEQFLDAIGGLRPQGAAFQALLRRGQSPIAVQCLRVLCDRVVPPLRGLQFGRLLQQRLDPPRLDALLALRQCRACLGRLRADVAALEHRWVEVGAKGEVPHRLHGSGITPA